MTSDICILPLALWEQFGSVIADINQDFQNNNTSAAHSNLSKLQVMYDKITRTATRNDKIENKKEDDIQSETKSTDYDDDAKTTNTTTKSIDSTLKEMKVEEFEQMMDKIESDNEAEIEKQSQDLKTLQTSTNDDTGNPKKNPNSGSNPNAITIDFNKCFSVAFDAAIEAGKLIYDVSIDSEARLGIQNRSKTKLNHADIVTEVDKASEKLIIGKLKSAFGKDYFILGEESADNKDVYKIDEISKNKPVWCIDPIDGTTNFYFGLPMTCIAIGLRYKCQTMLGIVYNPIINELFFAIKGSGSYLLNTTKLIKQTGINNNKNRDKDYYQQYKLESMMKLSERLQTSSMKFIPHTSKDNLKNEESDTKNGSNSNVSSIDDGSTTMSIGFKKAMIIMYAGYGSEVAVDDTIVRLNILLKQEKIRGLRMLGSCAIGMCYVACGRCHLYFEGHNRKYGIKPWDVVAAEIIVKEAGGNVYLPNDINGTFDTTQGRVLACNNETAATVFQQLNLYKNSSNE